MPTSRSRSALIALVLVVAAAGAGCSSSGDQSASSATAAVSPQPPPATFAGRAPADIAPPSSDGKGMNVPQPAAPLPAGYVAEEHLIGGTATSFQAAETPDDGRWTATPEQEAAYRTRVIVRRPTSAAAFSGTVIVEWFNVSAIEASPDWAFLSKEIGREGHAYIGVSAQAQGVEGGDTLLDVQVDPSQAQGAGVSTDTSGLKNIDPERYGSLVHPGDAYAFDMFSQIGRAASDSSSTLLGGLQVKNVIAAGESQSAAFLSTYVNAVHPLDPAYDGFLIHSRGGGAAPVNGDLAGARGGDNADAFRQQRIQIRTDIDVPVFIFETETDLTLLGYANARQPDTDHVRTWEVAGLAHADAHFIRAIVGGPRDPGVGDLLGCPDPINVGPQHEVLQAAVHHLVAWVTQGQPPPGGTAIQLTAAQDTTIARDDHGIALGGVRHPLVDAPTATLSGDVPGGASLDDLTSGNGRVCALFGSTTPFERQALLDRYGSADAYVAAFTASARETVAAGHLLQPDADALIAEAEANRSLFG